MNDLQLEALLLGSRVVPKQHSAFTQTVMRQIQNDATFAGTARIKGTQPKWSLLMRLRTLHGTGLAIAIVAATFLLTGVVYAGIRFTPDLIQLLDKRTNEQGHTEYSVPAFAQCQSAESLKIDTFAVRPTAAVDDQEVQKILQAKCELESIGKFASDTWPTYGQNKDWKDGDTIYYTRPDLLGTIKTIDQQGVTIEYRGGIESEKTYKTFQNQELLAYGQGQKISIHDVRPGDFIFVIERVAETYRTNPASASGAPRGVGAIAVVKMSQPKEYYGSKQGAIYEVQPCLQNPGETCSKEHQTGIDIFPRGSEGAANPALRKDTSSGWREIHGVVTAISDKEFAIKSNKGTLFTVHLSKAVLDEYNREAAPLYQQNGKIEASGVSVHEGSWVSVLYQQAVGDNPRQIELADIVKVYLLTDLPRK